MKKAVFLCIDSVNFQDSSSGQSLNAKESSEIIWGLEQLYMNNFLIIAFSKSPINNDSIRREQDFKIQNEIIFYPFSQEHNTEEIKHALLKTSKEQNIDLTKSWLIGNTLNYIEAGNYFGSYTTLLDNGKEDEWFFGPMRSPNLFVKEFKTAIDNVINFTNDHKNEISSL